MILRRTAFLKWERVKEFAILQYGTSADSVDDPDNWTVCRELHLAVCRGDVPVVNSIMSGSSQWWISPHEYEALRKTVDRELLKTPLDQSVQHGNVKTTIFIFTYIRNQQLTTMWEERVLLWTSALKFSCAHRIGCALLAKYDALQVFCTGDTPP